jgi:hypothetical protein
LSIHLDAKSNGSNGLEKLSYTRKMAVLSVHVNAQPVDEPLLTIEHLQDTGKFILPKDRRI